MDPNPDPARRFCHENIRLRHERNAEREERARLQRIVGYLDAERAQERDLAEHHFGTIAGLRHRCAFLEGVREDFGRERQEFKRKLSEVKGELRKLTDDYIARVEELGRERRLTREYEGRLRAREERRAGRELREQVEGVRAQHEHAQREVARLDQELRNERRVSSDLRTQRDQERAAATTFHEQVLHSCLRYGNSAIMPTSRLAIGAGGSQAGEERFASAEGGHGPSSSEANHGPLWSDEQLFPTGDGGVFIPPSDDTEDSDDRGDLDYDPFSNFEPYTTIDPRYTRQFPSFARPASTFARPVSTSAADNTTNDERTGMPVPNFAAFNADGQYVDLSPPGFAAFTAGNPHLEPPLPNTAAFTTHNQHFAPPQELQSAPDRPRRSLGDEWRDRLRRCTRNDDHPRSQHASAVDEEAAPAPGPSRFVPPPGRSAGPRISDDVKAQQGHPGDVTAKVLERLGRLEEQGNSTAQCLRRVEENLGYIMRNIGTVALATQPPPPAQRESGSRAEDQGGAISERPRALGRVVPDARASSTQRGAADISVGENCRLEGISMPDRLINGTPSPREQALATVAPSVMDEGSGTVIPHGGNDETSRSGGMAHRALAPADLSSTPSEVVHPKGPRPLPPTPARASSALLHQSPVSSSVTMLDSPHIVQPPRNIDGFRRGTKSNPSSDVSRLRGGDANQVVGDDVPYASIQPNDAHDDNASVTGTSAGSEDSMADHDVSSAHEHDQVDQPAFIPFRLTAHENDGALYILLEDVDALVANTSSPTAGTLVDNEVRFTIVLSEVIAMSVRARVHVMHSGDRTRPILRLSVRTRSRFPADAICRTLATAGELKLMRSVVLDMPDEAMEATTATDLIAEPAAGIASLVDMFSERVSYFGAAVNVPYPWRSSGDSQRRLGTSPRAGPTGSVA